MGAAAWKADTQHQAIKRPKQGEAGYIAVQAIRESSTPPEPKPAGVAPGPRPPFED